MHTFLLACPIILVEKNRVIENGVHNIHLLIHKYTPRRVVTTTVPIRDGFGFWGRSMLVVSAVYKQKTQGTKRGLLSFRPPKKKPFVVLVCLYWGESCEARVWHVVSCVMSFLGFSRRPLLAIIKEARLQVLCCSSYKFKSFLELSLVGTSCS
jgi:hypothetical protein